MNKYTTKSYDDLSNELEALETRLHGIPNGREYDEEREEIETEHVKIQELIESVELYSELAGVSTDEVLPMDAKGTKEYGEHWSGLLLDRVKARQNFTEEEYSTADHNRACGLRQSILTQYEELTLITSAEREATDETLENYRTPIKTEEQANAFIEMLFKNGHAFHLDEDPREICYKPEGSDTFDRVFTDEYANALTDRQGELFTLLKDPHEKMLDHLLWLEGQKVRKHPEAKKVTTSDEYARTNGQCCPYCQSDEIEGQMFEVEGQYAYQSITCNSCDSEWRDEYKLIGYNV